MTEIPEGIQDLVIGSLIGSGYSRDVYKWLPDETLVVKIAKGYRGIEANVTEFSFWESVAFDGELYNNTRDLLAPCHEISVCGKFLLMKKTEPVRLCDAPTVIPSFMTDIKLENIGWYENRIVSHDYALNFIVEDAVSLKKAKIIKREMWVN